MSPKTLQPLSKGQEKHQQETAKARAEGYKNAWERRKAMKQATYVPIQKPRPKGFGHQPESMHLGQPTNRLDRLGGHDGPVKILMKEGVWLAH